MNFTVLRKQKSGVPGDHFRQPTRKFLPVADQWKGFSGKGQQCGPSTVDSPGVEAASRGDQDGAQPATGTSSNSHYQPV